MILFDIKRYSINDGPGIRTTIFFKGCPLCCVWCHNPESWSVHPQKLYKKSKCIGCSSCVAACPNGAIQLTSDGIKPVEGSHCVQCGKCTEVCPTTALELCGRDWTMEELMFEIEKERDIMTDSGGGVTLCGGEPLMHIDDALAVLQELGNRGFHRTVDTTLHLPSEQLRKVVNECELFLVDLKHMDSAIHKKYTGVSNELILDNIRLLASLHKPMWIRIPLIEGINTDEQNIEASVRFISEIFEKIKESAPVQSLHTSHFTLHEEVERGRGEGLLPIQVNLLPYHDVGKDKHQRFWSHYNPQNIKMATPSEVTINHISDMFTAQGIKTIIGG